MFHFNKISLILINNFCIQRLFFLYFKLKEKDIYKKIKVVYKRYSFYSIKNNRFIEMIILFDDGNKKLTQEEGVNKNTNYYRERKDYIYDGGENFIKNKVFKVTMGM